MKIIYTIVVIQSDVVETEKIEIGTVVNYKTDHQFRDDFRIIKQYVDSNTVIFQQGGLGDIKFLKKIRVVIVSNEEIETGDKLLARNSDTGEIIISECFCFHNEGKAIQTKNDGTFDTDKCLKYVGEAPENIIRELIASPGLLPNKKPGDEVEVETKCTYEAQEDERDTPQEELDLDEFKENVLFNNDGTVNCK